MKNDSEIPPQSLYTPEETARELRISERKLWGLKASGALPYVKIGSCVRYARADIEELIAKHRRKGQE